MADEKKNVDIKEEKGCCFCKSEAFQKFLIVALGSFVGVFCALSLFITLNRPPMPLPDYHPGMMMPPPPHHHMKPVPPHFAEPIDGPGFHSQDMHRPDIHKKMKHPERP